MQPITEHKWLPAGRIGPDAGVSSETSIIHRRPRFACVTVTTQRPADNDSGTGRDCVSHGPVRPLSSAKRNKDAWDQSILLASYVACHLTRRPLKWSSQKAHLPRRGNTRSRRRGAKWRMRARQPSTAFLAIGLSFSLAASPPSHGDVILAGL